MSKDCDRQYLDSATAGYKRHLAIGRLQRHTRTTGPLRLPRQLSKLHLHFEFSLVLQFTTQCGCWVVDVRLAHRQGIARLHLGWIVLVVVHDRT